MKERKPILITTARTMVSHRTQMTFREMNDLLNRGSKFQYVDLGLCNDSDFDRLINDNKMNTDFLINPVITGDFKPKFYWTGILHKDAERINAPHIKQEGEKEDRIKETLDILSDLEGFTEFKLEDVFNIQNRLLKQNNWRGVKSGFREHNISFHGTPDFIQVKELTEKLFPITVMNKDALLEWYKQIQMIHPLSDLNGRVFGIIVSILNEIRISKNIQ